MLDDIQIENLIKNFHQETNNNDDVDLIEKFYDLIISSEENSDQLNGISFNLWVLFLEKLFVNEKQMSYYVPVVWAQEIFQLFDQNHDGLLDYTEFELAWNNWISRCLKPKSALIIVDVQNDFISGSLAVNKCPAGHNGHDVIPVINQLIQLPFDLIVFTLDWHPENHISFYQNLNSRKWIKTEDEIKTAESKTQENKIENVKVYDKVIFKNENESLKIDQIEQVLWPTHCVQNSWGAEIHQEIRHDLIGKKETIKIYKGTHPDIDSYSAFWDNNKLNQTNLYDELSSRNISDVFVCGLAYDVCVGFTACDALDFGLKTVIIDDASKGLNQDDIDKMKLNFQQKNGVIIKSDQVLYMIKGDDRRPELGYGLAMKMKDVQPN